MAYAIFKTGGKQYKVQQGDKIDVEKIDVEVGGEASFSEILMVGDGSSTKIGDPIVEGASVTAEVIDQHRAKKVTEIRRIAPWASPSLYLFNGVPCFRPEARI